MVPLATGANALDEDRACRVEVRDLLGETDDAAVTDPDDSTDRLAFAGAFRDRPGCNDTVDTGEFHLSAGTIKDQFSRGSRVRFELVLECVRPKFQGRNWGIPIAGNYLCQVQFPVSGYILINRSASACSASAS